MKKSAKRWATAVAAALIMINGWGADGANGWGADEEKGAEGTQKVTEGTQKGTEDVQEASVSYRKAATTEGDAVKVSDGVKGAVVWGSFPDEKIVIEDGDEELAKLTIRHSVPTKSRVVGYERGYDGEKHRAYTRIQLSEGMRDQQVMASGVDSVIVIDYGREVPLNCTLSLTSDLTKDVTSFDDLITMKGKTGSGERFTLLLKVLPGKGNITTNPDASLALNHMDGAMLVLTTLKGDDCDGDKGLIRMFEATLAAADGGIDGFGKPGRYSAENFTVSDKAPGEEYADVTALCTSFYPVERPAKEGEERVIEEWRQEVLRCAPGKIVFVPGTALSHPDGQTGKVTLPGDINVVYHWEKGKVTGGYVTYTPSDEMYPRETDVDLIVNGEYHQAHLKAWKPVPLENFVELVRPFIE